MQTFDVIKYEGDNSTFVWKHPCEDFNSLTQLIVHESQEALFMMNGQALDLFGAGRYTLETQNLPQLGKLLNRGSKDKNPFHCEVYFINKTVQMGIKWGTDSRVRFIDPNLGIPLEIGAYGTMNLTVSNSRKLLVKLVGTMKGIAWDEEGEGFTKSLHNSFRPMISTAVKTHLAASIKSEKINVLEIDENLEKLSKILKYNITQGFEDFGLTIPQFYINGVLLPDDNPKFNEMRELHSLSFDLKLEDAKKQKEIAAAQRMGEVDIIGAQVEAQKHKLQGFAEAEVMRAQGYSKKDVIQADVQKAYAEGLGKMGSNGGGIASDFVGLGVGMAAAGAVGAQMGDWFKDFNAPSQQMASDSSFTNTAACEKCGASLPENAKFCLECGAKIVATVQNEIICPSCKKKTVSGKFCMECGASLIRTCKKCGAEVSPEAKFCAECGESMMREE